jgi:hypothetical protein
MTEASAVADPLTPTLSPAYGGEGAIGSLSRLRERVGVRVKARHSSWKTQ